MAIKHPFINSLNEKTPTKHQHLFNTYLLRKTNTTVYKKLIAVNKNNPSFLATAGYVCVIINKTTTNKKLH